MQHATDENLISPARYARLRSLNRSTISRQIAAGQIPTVNGKVDPVAADAARENNLDAIRSEQARRRKLEAAGNNLNGTRREQAADRKADAAKNNLNARDRAAAFPPTKDVADVPAGAPGDFDRPPTGSLAEAQLIYAQAKGKRATIEVQGLEGKFISADEVRAAQTERATAEREALLNWPSSGVAAELAAKFGVPERDMFLALDVEVRRYLEKRSQQPLDGIAV